MKCATCIAIAFQNPQDKWKAISNAVTVYKGTGYCSGHLKEAMDAEKKKR